MGEYTRLVRSGSLLEVFEYQYAPKIALFRSRCFVRRFRKVLARRPDNIRRLRAVFVRLVLSNLVGAERPSFFTLTMYQILPVATSYSALTNFVKRLRRRFGDSFRYIAVPEFQRRGAVHFHVLFWGLSRDVITHERRTRDIQNCWGYGTIDCFETDGSPKIAGYLGKYLSKAMFDSRLLGQKAYVASRNVLRPLSVAFHNSFALVEDEFVGKDYPLVSFRSYDTMWLGRATYKKYNLKSSNESDIDQV